jgi:hypothetical protein
MPLKDHLEACWNTIGQQVCSYPRQISLSQMTLMEGPHFDLPRDSHIPFLICVSHKSRMQLKNDELQLLIVNLKILLGLAIHKKDLGSEEISAA